MATLTRRELVALGGWTLLARPMRQFRATQDDLSAWLREHVDGASLAPVAAAFREKHPDETSERLRAELLGGRRDGEDLAAHLSRKVREDFGAGRVEMLDGWILSRTEGRLIALTIDD